MEKSRKSRLIKSALIAVALAALVLDSGAGFAQGMGKEPAMVVKTGIGSVLADATGMTLYTFRKDVAGKSNCNGKCAQAWPPLMAAASDKSIGDYSVVKRADGGLQWAIKGKPLYTWVRDKKKGDTTGNGFKNAWDAARP